ncbi:DUF3078 domain-containing protein [Xanthovirga aplysinae]|uniref:DUF3078 domain-containing protein n=1 Tax=Xanthovirga aplysinae TaxID=2529853 RepID=UPI0012BBB782|nr:DUF3078 domain-containing protein [Xanthovirga aplysinae]MTI31912.1 DUF3078 domain-containing protein [Xanthovirga aplysinae]
MKKPVIFLLLSNLLIFLGLSVNAQYITLDSLKTWKNDANSHSKQGEEESTPDSLKNWKAGGLFSLNFSQATFKNWAGGGANSIAGNSLIDAYLNYNGKKYSWTNRLVLAFGKQFQEGQKPIKSDDNINFTSKLGRNFVDKWYYSTLIDFKTQFAKGFENSEEENYFSRFMAPAYLTYSLGLDYKPKDQFSFYFSPLTGRTIIVNDERLANEGLYTVTPGQKAQHQFGGYLNFFLKQEIMENINLQTNMELFSNYLYKPQNMDFNWEILISMKVNKFISASLNTQFIYDDDVKTSMTDSEGNTILKGPRLQWKEVLGIGLSFNLN